MSPSLDIPARLRGITALSRDELADWCRSRRQPAYRAEQVRHWLFAGRAATFDDMRNLPVSLRKLLAEEFSLFETRVIRHQVARDGTEKLLLALEDSGTVECVLMRESNRRTVCLSTQVGCPIGCVFCASGLLGLKRNLSTAEILEQVLRVDRLLRAGERITNVVVMGIGEPLANLHALLPAVETLSEADGLGLGMRRITISTVGLPDKIRELAALGRPYNLAVSLHAPNDELRTRLVPVNAQIGLGEILKAADDYFEQTGRRVTYEYVLLGGLNDGPLHARQLAILLKSRNAHVNLIPMNAIADLPFQPPKPAAVRAFVQVLCSAGVQTTLRKRKGADIDAACGQLRLETHRQPGRRQSAKSRGS